MSPFKKKRNFAAFLGCPELLINLHNICANCRFFQFSLSLNDILRVLFFNCNEEIFLTGNKRNDRKFSIQTCRKKMNFYDFHESVDFVDQIGVSTM